MVGMRMVGKTKLTVTLNGVFILGLDVPLKYFQFPLSPRHFFRQAKKTA
jgi:hypothetical protein